MQAARLALACVFPLAVFFLLGRGLFGTSGPGRTGFERTAFRIAAGLGLFPLLAAGCAWAGIPFTPIWVFGIAAALSIASARPAPAPPAPAGRITRGERLATALALAHFAFYAGTGLRQTLLEDTDAWEHAYGAAYVAAGGRLLEPSPAFDLFHYLDPYPPAFEGLLGLGTAIGGPGSVALVLKLLGGALGPSLAVWLVFFWIRAMTGAERAGVYGAVLYALLPCAPTRFVWAIAWAVPVFLAGAWALEEARGGGKTKVLAAAILAGSLLVQPSLPPKLLGLLVAALALRAWFGEPGARGLLWVPVAAAAISLLVWWGPQIARHGPREIAVRHKRLPGAPRQLPYTPGQLLLKGSADRPVSLPEVAFPRAEGNRTHAPVGLGLGPLACAVLSILSFAYRWVLGRDDGGGPALAALVVWLLSLLSVFGENLSALSGGRLPMPFSYQNGFLLALATALFGGIYLASLRILPRSRRLVPLLLALAALSSGVPKARILAARWAPDWRFFAPGEAADLRLALDAAARDAAPGAARVFDMAGNLPLAGLGRPSPDWDPEVAAARAAHADAAPLYQFDATRMAPPGPPGRAFSGPELHAFLRRHGYTHVLFDARFLRGSGAVSAAVPAPLEGFEAVPAPGRCRLFRVVPVPDPSPRAPRPS